MNLEIHFDNRPWAGSTACYIVLIRADGARMIAKPMELIFEPFEQNGLGSPKPSIEFGPYLRADGFFEALVKALAAAGYKAPTNENDVGELKATKVHLADLQKLVFEPVRMTKIIRNINEGGP